MENLRFVFPRPPTHHGEIRSVSQPPSISLWRTLGLYFHDHQLTMEKSGLFLNHHQSQYVEPQVCISTTNNLPWIKQVCLSTTINLTMENLRYVLTQPPNHHGEIRSVSQPPSTSLWRTLCLIWQYRYHQPHYRELQVCVSTFKITMTGLFILDNPPPPVGKYCISHCRLGENTEKGEGRRGKHEVKRWKRKRETEVKTVK